MACTHCGPSKALVHTKHDAELPETLHIIVPLSNYVPWATRYELFFRCMKHLESLPNVAVYVVEVALGQRPFVCTQANNPRHLQLRTHMMLWHKESMVNAGIRRLLPPNWKYVAWCDADLQFLNTNVAADTIHALQHWNVVQMFRSVCNLGPEGEILLPTYESFGYKFVESGGIYAPKLTPRSAAQCAEKPEGNPEYGPPSSSSATHYVAAKDYWHPGFAWACTRRAYEEGMRDGLIDFAILGSGDDHMAKALVGVVSESYHGSASEGYKKACDLWQERALSVINRNLGYVKGTIVHGYHGRFADRKYVERWSVLTQTGFDPYVDLHRCGVSGLSMLADEKRHHRLRDLIRQYFLQRNEDSR